MLDWPVDEMPKRWNTADLTCTEQQADRARSPDHHGESRPPRAGDIIVSDWSDDNAADASRIQIVFNQLLIVGLGSGYKARSKDHRDETHGTHHLP